MKQFNVKEQKGGFRNMLIGKLDASLTVNMLVGKGINKGGENVLENLSGSSIKSKHF